MVGRDGGVRACNNFVNGTCKAGDNCQLSHDIEDSKIFKCATCSKVFTSKWGMTYHSRSHTGERPRFPCGLCQATFGSRSDQTKHIRRRHGLENYRYDRANAARLGLEPVYPRQLQPQLDQSSEKMGSKSIPLHFPVPADTSSFGRNSTPAGHPFLLQHGGSSTAPPPPLPLQHRYQPGCFPTLPSGLPSAYAHHAAAATMVPGGAMFTPASSSSSNIKMMYQQQQQQQYNPYLKLQAQQQQQVYSHKLQNALAGALSSLASLKQQINVAPILQQLPSTTATTDRLRLSEAVLPASAVRAAPSLPGTLKMSPKLLEVLLHASNTAQREGSESPTSGKQGSKSPVESNTDVAALPLPPGGTLLGASGGGVVTTTADDDEKKRKKLGMGFILNA